MMRLYPATQRGQTRLEWLDSRHTFSFGSFHDPERMGFGALRVINEDRVAPGVGFEMHPHRDIEIVSYVLAGTMTHRDSTGASGLIQSGQFQLMSAGSGVRHSELNASGTSELHFLQIGIEPASRGGAPRYGQRDFPGNGGMRLIASPDGRDGSLRLQQDASLRRVVLHAGDTHTLISYAARRSYIHVVRGRLRCGPHHLGAGDGLALHSDADTILQAESACEALLFDLPE